MDSDAEPILAVANEVDEGVELVTFPSAERQRVLNRVAYGLLCYRVDLLEAKRPIDRRIAQTALDTAYDMTCRFGYGATLYSVAAMVSAVREEVDMAHSMPEDAAKRRAYLVMAASRLARKMEERRVPGT